MKDPVNICWFRRDLRLHDNAALYHSLRAGLPVVPLFIFDTNILDELEKTDPRVQFIYNEIERLHQQLRAIGSGFKVFRGTPLQAFQLLTREYQVREVFTNRDYEKYARDRDLEVETFLKTQGVAFHSYKDQVIFDHSEVVKNDGSPYVVYTPYSREWKSKLNEFFLRPYPVEKYTSGFVKNEPDRLPALEELGFSRMRIEYPDRQIDDACIADYDKLRNFPAANGTTRIGIHLRFGTVSIRELALKALEKNTVYLNELIWREFYMMILWHFPHVAQGKAFRNEYDRIEWRNNEDEFQHWCEGTTGYPMVDAGMRQLNATGYMHNRVRMVAASFLSKHLLIDWRWGEAYFASKLLDYDFASNNGGWQWAAGSGCDAAPYFRIFNPLLQAKKFDPKGEYIRKWVPDIEQFGYPSPLVDHDFARKRCLSVYGRAIKVV
jgi:deoxyribodipyrimidine photo-lyase